MIRIFCSKSPNSANLVFKKFILFEKATNIKIKIEAYEIDCDNVNLFIKSTPNITVSKIVQYLGLPVRYSWPAYLQIADAGGFLNFDFLLDEEITSKLNNNDYNTLM